MDDRYIQHYAKETDHVLEGFDHFTYNATFVTKHPETAREEWYGPSSSAAISFLTLKSLL